MVDNVIIPDIAPLAKDVIQTGAPLMSAHESHMAMQTTALWHKGTGSVKSFFWPNPGTAPVCYLVAGNYSADVQFYTCGIDVIDNSPAGVIQYTTLNVPWLVHPRIERIHIRALIAMDANHPVYLSGTGDKFSATDTISSVILPSSKSSGEIPKTYPPTEQWALGSYIYGYTSFLQFTTSFIPSVPTSPTSRLITINPAMRWQDSTFPFAAGISVNIFLCSLEIYEELETPE